MFLEPEEIIQLTGLRQKKAQIAQLKRMGIPFFVNASGHPVVAVAAIQGGKSAEKPKPQWSPTWAASHQ
jgi:hypothetical protein